jgi:hypothetical protein
MKDEKDNHTDNESQMRKDKGSLKAEYKDNDLAYIEEVDKTESTLNGQLEEINYTLE